MPVRTNKEMATVVLCSYNLCEPEAEMFLQVMHRATGLSLEGMLSILNIMAGEVQND